jgi:hypothetical protein
MTKRKSTTSNGTENSITRSERGPSLEDLEEAETTLWLEQQLNCIHDFLVKHGAHSEMLDAADYLIEDNVVGWIRMLPETCVQEICAQGKPRAATAAWLSRAGRADAEAF